MVWIDRHGIRATWILGKPSLVPVEDAEMSKAAGIVSIDTIAAVNEIKIS